MRRPAAVLLMFALTACGGGTTHPVATPPASSSATSSATSPAPEPLVTRADGTVLSCDGPGVQLPSALSGLSPAGSFSRLESLRRPLKVRGRIWSDSDERLYVGVVCGPRTAEQFVTLVGKATLTLYGGKPALRWTTRTGVRCFMWLERPGTAVYIGTTPGLSSEIKPIAADITAG
ncbi:hypothetical protein ABZW11_40255 [Nonomuraea sp. NPDC004580]|uniref:hypothetical protein n=1 Tax=Nonomuraea sp. NPDC004580 TaxID=3154552 RepID=UPI0033B96FF2